MTHSKGKKKKRRRRTDTIPEKDQMADLLDKDLKTTVLKMVKELKEDLDKVKKKDV